MCNENICYNSRRKYWWFLMCIYFTWMHAILFIAYYSSQKWIFAFSASDNSNEDLPNSMQAPPVSSSIREAVSYILKWSERFWVSDTGTSELISLLQKSFVVIEAGDELHKAGPSIPKLLGNAIKMVSATRQPGIAELLVCPAFLCMKTGIQCKHYSVYMLQPLFMCMLPGVRVVEQICYSHTGESIYKDMGRSEKAFQDRRIEYLQYTWVVASIRFTDSNSQWIQGHKYRAGMLKYRTLKHHAAVRSAYTQATPNCPLVTYYNTSEPS